MTTTAAATPASSSTGVLTSFPSSRLSSSELSYISDGVAANLRTDGRARLDYRPLSVEVGMLTNANGSSRVRLESTDVLVAVNLSMSAPLENVSGGGCEGRVVCSVEQCAACVVDMEERAITQANALLTAQLARLFSHSSALPLASLVIVPDQQVWTVYIDVLIVENGGNILDAIAMAVKAALINTTMPPIEVIAGKLYSDTRAHSHGDRQIPPSILFFSALMLFRLFFLRVSSLIVCVCLLCM